MSPVPLLGAVVAFALVLVVAWMFPVDFSGETLLAVVLIAVLAAIFVCTALAREFGDVEWVREVR